LSAGEAGMPQLMSANNLLPFYFSMDRGFCPVFAATGRYFLLAAKESNQRKLPTPGLCCLNSHLIR